jgi:hypothetical protein
MGRILMTGAATAFAMAALAPVAMSANDVASCGTRHIIAPTKRIVPGRAPLVIGDSVLLGAVDPVAAAGYEVDVRGCRGMDEVLDVLRERARSRRLPGFVVVQAGTNFDIRDDQVDRALRILGPDRVLGLMTPRELGGGSGQDAIVVRNQARRHAGRVLVIDWVRWSAGRGGWFSGDGIHLGPAGATGFANLLTASLRRIEVRGRGRPQRGTDPLPGAGTAPALGGVGASAAPAAG